MSYFIHFGCWNNGNCYKKNELNKVVSKISKLFKKNKDNLKFISVCGDNYYPIKEKNKTTNIKKKIYILDDLISGFQCLRNSISKNVSIYMTYGNHDFEMDNNFQNIDSNCTITNDQTKVAKLFNITLKLWQEVDFNKNTKLILIDTSIYDEPKIKEYINCYKSINNIYDSINTIKQEQNKFINNIINKIISNRNIKNIIITGHHPLAYLKIKEKDEVKQLKFEILGNFGFRNINLKFDTLKIRNSEV